MSELDSIPTMSFSLHLTNVVVIKIIITVLIVRTILDIALTNLLFRNGLHLSVPSLPTQ